MRKTSCFKIAASSRQVEVLANLPDRMQLFDTRSSACRMPIAGFLLER
jgi:hypothetical protein